MRNKLSFLEKVILIASGFLKLASNSSAQETTYASNPLQVPTRDLQIEQPKDDEIGFYFEQTLGTNYMFSSSGSIIARENPRNHSGVSQTYLSATKNNLTAWMWTSYDFEDGKNGNGLHELDTGAEYKTQISDSISLTGGGASWMYPSGFLGKEAEYTIYLKTSIRNPLINFDMTGNHLFGHDQIGSGQAYAARFSRDFSIGKVLEYNLTFSPRVEGGFTNNFYDDNSFGLRTVNTGLELTLSKEEDPLSIKLSYTHQDGIRGVEDFDYGSITVGASF